MGRKQGRGGCKWPIGLENANSAIMLLSTHRFRQVINPRLKCWIRLSYVILAGLTLSPWKFTINWLSTTRLTVAMTCCAVTYRQRSTRGSGNEWERLCMRILNPLDLCKTYGTTPVNPFPTTKWKIKLFDNWNANGKTPSRWMAYGSIMGISTEMELPVSGVHWRRLWGSVGGHQLWCYSWIYANR